MGYCFWFPVFVVMFVYNFVFLTIFVCVLYRIDELHSTLGPQKTHSTLCPQKTKPEKL